MSPTMSAASCTKPSVSASIVLAPRDLKLYRRWQRLYTTLSPAQQGLIPTPLEYEDFKQWLKRQDSGYFSDVYEDVSERVDTVRLPPTTTKPGLPIAAICQHTMHPVVADQLRLRCPVCTITIHMQYLDVLTQALESAGGRAPSCTLIASEYQDNVYSAWVYGKMCTLREVSELHRIADEEAQWSAQHHDPQNQHLQTAEKALEHYWSETCGCTDERSPSPKRQSVKFAEETAFEPGRPSAYFWKRSPRYEAGKYTPTEPDDEDTDVHPDDPKPAMRVTACHASTNDESKNHSKTSESGSPPDSYVHILKRDIDDDGEENIEEDDGDSDWEDIDSDDDKDLMFGDDEFANGDTSSDTDTFTSFILFEDD